MKKVVLRLSGLTCMGCVANVKAALEKAGAKEVEVTLDKAEFLAEEESVQKFIDAVKESGYGAELV
jgi:copper chaperone CopZ